MIAWFYNKVWSRHIITKTCRGCNDPSPHDAHLTRFGWWRITHNA